VRYAYRRLEVGWEDERAGPGTAPDRCRIHDSGGDSIELVRASGEDPAAFAARRVAAVMDLLNTLGGAGWRVLYYAPAVLRGPVSGETAIAPWPVGTHFLAREGPEDAPATGA
jgi:hypothetical protein